MVNLDLRAASADRQRVVADLQRHYADGRITTDKRRERVGLAMAARTFDDLDVLRHDLAALEPAPAAPPPPHP